jgi:hypothetical protein
MLHCVQSSHACVLYLQRLADAAADYATFRVEDNGYDIVQLAAVHGRLEAVVKLVEAGASWRLAPGQERVVKGALMYVPEILSRELTGVKVSMTAQNSTRTCLL